MIDIQPNYAAVKQGLIPITPQEQMKLDKDGLDVIHDIYRYAKTGFASIDPDDFDRMKWYGVYRQKPKDSGYFMMRLRLPGGQVNGAQAIKISEVADRFVYIEAGRIVEQGPPAQIFANPKDERTRNFLRHFL
jgi:ferredoxin-nitrite reductase